MRLVLPIDPTPAPRQTRRDKWNPRPRVVRYRAFRDSVREVAGDVEIPDGPMSLAFGLAMPASWSKKKREAMNGTPHRQKPDADNLAKAVLDALWPEGDAGVWDVRIVKRWATAGSIIIDIEEIA